jgi:hypothetical protein
MSCSRRSRSATCRRSSLPSTSPSTSSPWVTWLCTNSRCHLLPSALSPSSLQTAAATHLIEEGTFCFRPARSIRWSWPNAFAIQGFVLEFIQHCTYVFPLGTLPPSLPHFSPSSGIITKEKASTVKDIPPYIPFLVYFWGSVASVFICGLILVLNAVLRVSPFSPLPPLTVARGRNTTASRTPPSLGSSCSTLVDPGEPSLPPSPSCTCQLRDDRDAALHGGLVRLLAASTGPGPRPVHCLLATGAHKNGCCCPHGGTLSRSY